jgi:hypothetical protein
MLSSLPEVVTMANEDKPKGMTPEEYADWTLAHGFPRHMDPDDEGSKEKVVLGILQSKGYRGGNRQDGKVSVELGDQFHPRVTKTPRCVDCGKELKRVSARLDADTYDAAKHLARWTPTIGSLTELLNILLAKWVEIRYKQLKGKVPPYMPTAKAWLRGDVATRERALANLFLRLEKRYTHGPEDPDWGEDDEREKTAGQEGAP